MSHHASGEIAGEAPPRSPGRRLRAVAARARALRVLAALGAAALLLAAAGCGGGSGGSVKSGGVLRVGTQAGIDSLNPFSAVYVDSYIYQEYAYPVLLTYDANNQLIGNFATSWSFSDGGRTLTFKTHPNAVWSDGKPLTAADAAWTLNTIVKFQAGATALIAQTVSHLKSASAPDATTLVLHYEKPVGNALSNLQQIPILPEHVWAKYATGKGDGLKSYANTPPNAVYGGPFIVTKWQKGAVTLFKRNPRFYGPKPQIAGWGLQVFGTPDAMATALQENQIDVALNLPPTAPAGLKGDAGVAVSSSPPGGVVNGLWINPNPHKTTHRELVGPNNRQIRLAFSMAMDRQRINDVAYLGYAKPAGSVIPPTLPGGDPSIQPPAFDIAGANRILDGLGYKRGSDGIRVANGTPMKYQVVFFQGLGGAGDRAFQILKDGFQKIGVSLTELSQADGTAYTTLTSPNGKVTGWDVAFVNTASLIDPDFLLSDFVCANLGTGNVTGYCNPAYDKLYAEQGTTPDQVKRVAIVHQMMAMLNRDLPILVINDPQTVTATRTQWTGLIDSIAGPVNSYSILSLTSVHRR